MLTCGRGRPWASRKARKRSSSSRFVMLRPMSRRSRSRLIAGVPGRPGYRAARSAREVGLPRRRISASVAARSRWWYGTIAARSRSVRAGVVTGIPSCLVISSSRSVVRCSCTRGRGFHDRDTTMSVRLRSAGRMPHTRGRGPMAQHRVLDDESRGPPRAIAGEDGVADRVDAPMHGVQPASPSRYSIAWRPSPNARAVAARRRPADGPPGRRSRRQRGARPLSLPDEAKWARSGMASMVATHSCRRTTNERRLRTNSARCLTRPTPLG